MSFVFLVSCAADPNNCQSGYVYGGTAYGCQPQGSCPSGEFQINGTGTCLTATNTSAVTSASCYSGYTLNSQYNVCCPASVTYNPAYGTSQGCIAATTTGTTGGCAAGLVYTNGACYTSAGVYEGPASTTGTYGTSGTPTPSGACPQNPTAGCYYYPSQLGMTLNHCYTQQGVYCGM